MARQVSLVSHYPSFDAQAGIRFRPTNQTWLARAGPNTESGDATVRSSTYFRSRSLRKYRQLKEDRRQLLGEICKELGFAEVRCRKHGMICYEARWQPLGDAAWTLQIPIDSDVSVDPVRHKDARPLGISIDLLVGSFGKA